MSYNNDISARLPGWSRKLINVRRDIAASAESRQIVTEYLFWNYAYEVSDK